MKMALRLRLRKGKEDPARLAERMGKPGLPRPAGKLVWFHAASVGEAQSTMILVESLLARFPDIHILVTTGTLTSADLMARRLPASRAFHQFYPLDHPAWVERFLDHWQPDLVLWMESELWPNMLRSLKARHVHCALLNARMSPRSLRRWQKVRADIANILSAFDLCLTQTETDEAAYRDLGALSVQTSGNLKYAATPLPCDANDLDAMETAIDGRPVWLYASTHDGEEDLACDLHAALLTDFPDLLTMIVPRHPDRSLQIAAHCVERIMNVQLRGPEKTLPTHDTGLYIADTLGELGLFYRAAPIACIGRSFSSDGGGGHNPIEAAQLGCAILHGPLIQNLSAIYADMDKSGAATCAATPQALQDELHRLLSDPQSLAQEQDAARRFATDKADVLPRIRKALEPLLVDSAIMHDKEVWT